MRFQVLGPVTAYGERGPVALAAARQRTVLAALVIEPGAAVGFEQLIDRVWGDEPPRRARETMHAYLSRLRAALADAAGPALVRRAHSYTLEVPPEAVDLGRFRSLAQQARRVADDDRSAELWREALGLWRGAPLADLDSDWARGVATALETERLGAVLDRNDVLLRRGEHAELLPELTGYAAAHPLDERLAGQLMLALYRSGRQAAALAHYRSLMERLADELGSDPGPALRHLHQQILRQDPELAATTEVANRPQGDPPFADQQRSDTTPAQLPADIAGFTGRAEPLRQLDALLGPVGQPLPTVTITAIGGSAGIGKTALAVHWAHRVADRFPDGQLYLNLRGFDPGGQAMSTAEALRNLLELLGVPPARIPTGVEAQAGLYRTRLAGTRTLVVLDNARDTEQVRPLIPGAPGSMVLVTSRDQLAGLAATEGAQLVRLDVLGDAEARQL
ncbi:MAG: BTAD domain-containing putative transcriptional regulator, partial [Micromonosporaceae bacterium]